MNDIQLSFFDNIPVQIIKKYSSGWLIKATCPICGSVFNRITLAKNPLSAKRKWYCSDPCKNKGRLIKCTCAQCGKHRTKLRCLVNGHQWYCSKSCFNKAHPGGKPRCHGWTPEELRILREKYPVLGPKGCAEIINKSSKTIHNMAKSLGVTISLTNRCIIKKRWALRGEDHPFWGKSHHWITEDGKKRLSESKKGDKNPMRRPDVINRVKNYWNEHPQKRQEMTERLIKACAKWNRCNGISKPESLLKKILTKKMIPHLHQYIIKPNFVVDFFLPEHTLKGTIIEVAGEYWHAHPRYNPLSNTQIGQQKRDMARQAYLTKCGYSVIWIWAEWISEDFIGEVLHAICGDSMAIDKYSEAFAYSPIISH